MKNVMISTAAVALAFGLSPYAGAQTVDNGSAAADDRSKAIVKTKIDDSYNEYRKTSTKNDTVTKTYTDSNNDTKIKDSYNEKTKWDGKAKNDYSPFGAAANNHSTASTRLDMNHSFNQTKIVNTTELKGFVSGVSVYGLGNNGGAAWGSGNYGGRGGDGGYAAAKAKSGDANGGYGGDGGKAKSGDGGYAYGGDGGKAKAGDGGYAKAGNGGQSNGFNNSGNSAGDDSRRNDARNNDADGRWQAGDGGYAQGGNGGRAEGGDGGYAQGERSGDANGGHGGDGGYAKSGDAGAQSQGGYGGNGARGGDVHGGHAGTFNASNTLSGYNGAAGITVAIQNTGIAAMQQVGVTTMANVTVGR